MKKTQLLIFAMLFSMATIMAQQPQDLTFNVSTSFQSSPFRIVLQWKPFTGATNIAVYRKAINVTTWTLQATLSATDTVYEDYNAASGTGYEYKIQANTSPVKYSYIYAGKDLPEVHSRGKVILLVDSNYIPSLNFEIGRLISDLAGDGWQVLRHNISRSSPVTAVKNIVKSDYLADPNHVRSLFILGHVPVPYTGNLNPDGHPDHQGAWPCDAFYADMNGTYTDVSVNNTVASRTENQNIPGDGKYDQSVIPGTVVLQTGRVDLFNMPAFSSNDTLLVKKYLDKDHAFRLKKNNPQRRALIDDNFGYFSGEAFASSGWRNFYSLLGADSTFAGDYFTDMKNQSYIWSYGCGGGSYTSCGGVGSTSNFVSDSLKNIFTMLFGSYFGDWDSQDNFLRAPLASNGWTLTDAWSGRPYWEFDHLSLGEPIGFSTKATQNNSSAYVYNYGGKFVHIALMGDPTLRMHIIAPPENLIITAINNGSSAQLNWSPSAEAVLGYYVYIADSLTGTFTLLTPSYITSTSYTDMYPTNGNKYYMVRAVDLENAYTGSYFNLSQGLMDTITIVNSTASIPGNDNDNFLVYPNPAKENITIEYPAYNNCVNGKISIFTMHGQLVLQKPLQQKTSMKISSLSEGIYLLKIETENGISFRKFIKE